MAVTSPTLAAIRDVVVADGSASDVAEGTVRLVFLDARAGVMLTTTTSERANEIDEFFVRYLESMITDVAAAGVILTVTRASGRPTRPDRALWRSLAARLGDAPTELVDLVVVGRDTTWSARARGRRSASRASAP